MQSTAEPDVTEKPPKRPFSIRGFTVTPAVEFAVLAVVAAVAVGTYSTVRANAVSERMLSPAVGSLLLLANLVPLVALIILLGRRIAKHRAARSAVAGGGQLHVRLVAIFSLLASIPIVLTVIAASFMFQSGIEFWVSDKARGAFEASMNMVRDSQQQIILRWAGEGRVMANDIARESERIPVGSPYFPAYFQYQTVLRNLEQSVLFRWTPEKGVQPIVSFNMPDDKVVAKRATPQIIKIVKAEKRDYVDLAKDSVWVVAAMPGSDDIFLYVGTSVNADFLNKQVVTADDKLREYAALQSRARSLQLQFNAVLFAVALLIVGAAVWIALAVADRLVRPINELVGAAREVAAGDLGARVPEPKTRDEVGVLADAFNQMTVQLQEQTNALVGANAQLESRRALIEAVMSGVTAGVISIDSGRKVRLINASAVSQLRHAEQDPVGRPLAEVAPELDALLDGSDTEAVVQIATAAEPRTLAVKITRDEGGQVLTFDDITQQLLDQRRAAWSDVARRIAHEIKNPLTPIQLAAERLQRRYGRKIEEGADVFAQLTDTIVRQVGDLRRIVDEFSSFARMPKPLFRQESLLDIARQSMFLHEVAHPTIRFELAAEDATPMVCDRRQIGQALTNVIKNAVEAIEGRGEGEALPQGEIILTIAHEEHRVTLTVSDNGVGLPVERDRIVEPYMTTRSRGTGLGLAIVKKIIEEHFGTIGFYDRLGGGTNVIVCFDTEMLANVAGTAEPETNAGAEPRLSALTRTGNKS
jgi:two-component system nitrogen regulation sensor histidine kinase NtrY